LRAVSLQADRRHQTEGDRRARQVRRADAAAHARSDLAAARTRVHLPRRETGADVSSGVLAAQPVLEARGVGRYETCAPPPPGIRTLIAARNLRFSSPFPFQISIS